MDGGRLSPTDGPRPALATDPRRWKGARLHQDTPPEGILGYRLIDEAPSVPFGSTRIIN